MLSSAGADHLLSLFYADERVERGVLIKSKGVIGTGLSGASL